MDSPPESPESPRQESESESESESLVEWEDSASPEEDWGDDVDEWPIKGIVGEEVTTSGDTRYEVSWQPWQREDGTCTTWMPYIPERADLVKSWKQKQKRVRHELAEESLDVEVGNDIDIHNVNTIERAQALAEKTEKRKKKPIKYHNWDSELDKNLIDKGIMVDNESRSRNLRAPSIRVEGRKSRTPSTKPASTSKLSVKIASGSRATQSPVPGPSRSMTLSSGSSSKPPSSLGLRESLSSQSSLPVSRSPRPLPTRALQAPILSPSQRTLLQTAWSQSSRKAKAAPIYIVNDVDEEETPPITQNFEYREQGYTYADDIPQPDKGNLLACECSECVSVAYCGCQVFSERERNDSEDGFAYVEGLFSFDFPPGCEVIECNELCSCDSDCPNRVAQQPRQFPVEIFKTENCGWGVRSTLGIERGQVLGVYTGKLIRRTEAETLPEEHKGYLFDLDSREAQDDDDVEDRFSVDSYDCGNWTRFINHSCDPNSRVYPVLYDTIPEMNQPYLAFVATRDIPVRTEFTLSYNPKASAPRDFGLNLKPPKGASPCRCSAKMCRGWR